MSHDDQASRLGFEKATTIAIDNLDGSCRANTAAFEELKRGLNQGLQAHARRLEALEARPLLIERPSVDARMTKLENLFEELSARVDQEVGEGDDDQTRDEDTEDMRTLLADACDCLCDPRFRDFVTRGRPLSSAHRAQLAGIMARLQPFAEDTLLG